jgi:hypothetical protein
LKISRRLGSFRWQPQRVQDLFDLQRIRTMSIISRLIEKLYGLPEARVLMVGLDNSGRTTALFKLKLGEVLTTIPTIG